MEKRIQISDFNYGFILDYFAKSKQMNHAYVIFEKLRKNKIEMSSIIFTTMIKGFINNGDHKTALIVFNDIKHLVEQPGMIITYNCMLDLLIIDSKIDEAMTLFYEIDKKFKVDLISYSTVVKGLCKANQRIKAFELINRMIESKIEYDVSIINMYLESCASSDDMKLGMSSFENLVKKNIQLNDITMGIMVKIYGACFKLKSAFDLLEYIAKHNMHPSLIFFTNLIHVSFFNKKPAKAELVATLMAKEKVKGDKLMFSKLIEGLLRFKQTQNIPTYIQQAIDDESTLKKELIAQLFEIYEDDSEVCQLIERVKYCEKSRVQALDENKKTKNNYHQNNTMNFKNQIWQKNKEKQEAEKKEQLAKEQNCRNLENPERKTFGGNLKKELVTDQTHTKQAPYFKNSTAVTGPKQPMVLHNFRANKKPE
jgi:pentatricopeptide repeat protein